MGRKEAAGGAGRGLSGLAAVNKRNTGQNFTNAFKVRPGCVGCARLPQGLSGATSGYYRAQYLAHPPPPHTSVVPALGDNENWAMVPAHCTHHCMVAIVDQ